MFKSEHGVLKHRTYLPVLRLYLKEGDIASALKVFQKMRDSSSVLLEPETYIQVVSAIAENGFFRYVWNRRILSLLTVMCF